jgi:hypothetical protein
MAFLCLVAAAPPGLAEPSSGQIHTIETLSSQGAVSESLTKITGLNDGAFAVAGRVTGGRRSGADIAVLEPRWRVAWAFRLAGADVHAIAPTDDSGFIAALTVQLPNDSPLRGQYGLQPTALAHFDRGGSRTWTKLLAVEKTAVIKALAPAPDGGFYAAGHTVRPRANRAEKPGLESFVLRADADGNPVWLKTIQIGRDEGVEILDVLSTAGSVFVVGRSAVFRMSSAGVLDWMLDIPEGVIWNAAPTENGVILGGFRTTSGRAGIDGLAISVGASGRIAWAVTIDAGASDRVEHIAALPGGGAVLTGSTRRMGPTLEDKVHRTDGWLVAIDAKGSRSWSYAFGGPFDDYLNAAATHSGILAAVGALGTGSKGQRFIASLALNPASAEATCGRVIPVNATVSPLIIEAHHRDAWVTDLTTKTASFELAAEPLEFAVRPYCPD